MAISRSQIILSATVWTRPAESPGLSFSHRTWETLNPTRRSMTRRAIWAFTLRSSMTPGWETASRMAEGVISWKSTRPMGFSRSFRISWRW